ncbi:hypothetical protein Tco_1398181 [Tanacetum coccineum]
MNQFLISVRDMTPEDENTFNLEPDGTDMIQYKSVCVMAFFYLLEINMSNNEAYQHFLLGYFNIDSDAAPYILCHRKLERAHRLFFSKDVTVVGAGVESKWVLYRCICPSYENVSRDFEGTHTEKIPPGDFIPR